MRSRTENNGYELHCRHSVRRCVESLLAAHAADAFLVRAVVAVMNLRLYLGLADTTSRLVRNPLCSLLLRCQNTISFACSDCPRSHNIPRSLLPLVWYNYAGQALLTRFTHHYSLTLYHTSAQGTTIIVTGPLFSFLVLLLVACCAGLSVRPAHSKWRLERLPCAGRFR